MRLILLFTFTASAMAAQQIAKINPKIIIILILSFLIVILLVFFCVSHLFAPQRNSAFSTCYFLRLILLFTFTASARAAQQIAKIKLKITIMLPFLSFFNSYFVIPNYASLSCLSATVSHAFSAASSFISDAKVVLFVFAHKY